MLIIVFLTSMFGMVCCNAAQELLPVADRCIVACEHLPGGLSHNIIKYKTSLGNYYIFRQGKKRINNDRFNRVVLIAQQAAELQLAPHIYNYNTEQQQMLMSYIPNVAWPAYEENEQPYVATMHRLKLFHDGMRSAALKSNPTTFQPFAAILDKEKQLLANPQMPKQLKVAFDRMKILYEKVLPWLKTHATIYHGDLKKKNVLIEQKENTLHPWFIDFEYAAVGHPYFDVVKFSQKLPTQQRLVLFQAYLGHVPTVEEMTHFTILDNALRMLIAIIRFDLALKVQAAAENQVLLSKKEMEDLLNSPEALPSQATILLSDPDPKKQQLAAVYALDDFLRNS